jgi:hypothetical protein
MNGFVLFFVVAFLSYSNAAANWCDDRANLSCMKNAINGEARGEGYNGMLMVGKTIATRLARGYRSSVCAVVGGAAFATKSSFPSSGAINLEANANIKKAAEMACALGDQNVSHFHSFKNKFAVSWAKKFTFVAKIGGHYFFNAPSYVKRFYEYDDTDGDLFMDEYFQDAERMLGPDFMDPELDFEGPLLEM